MRLQHTRRAVVACLAVLALQSVPVAGHAGNSSCTYSSGTVRLHIASEHVVRLFASNGLIRFADLTNYANKGQCGAGTVHNTDRVRISEEVAGNSRLQFDQQLARFGPGRGWESTGASEIEVYLGTLADVWLMGRAVGDHVVIGSGGVNINGDGDVDLIGTSLLEITAFLGDGNDSLSAGGGQGTGGAWSPTGGGYPLAVYADDGSDVIEGTNRADRIDGDAGEDRIYGRGGADDLRGGSHDDRISGGDGRDIIDPGPWFDTVSAGAGNDYIEAADFTADTIFGGEGTDRAVVDREDFVSGVEATSLGP